MPRANELRRDLTKLLLRLPGIESYAIRTQLLRDVKLQVTRHQEHFQTDVLSIIDDTMDASPDELDTVIENAKELSGDKGNGLFEDLERFQTSSLSLLKDLRRAAPSGPGGLPSRPTAPSKAPESIYDGYKSAEEAAGTAEKTTVGIINRGMRNAHAWAAPLVALLVAVLCTLLYLHPQSIPKWTLPDILALLPIALAHCLLNLETSNFYRDYINLWDVEDSARLETSVLWCVYLLAVIISLIAPEAWLMALACCLWAIFWKNHRSLRRLRGETAATGIVHPALTLLPHWLVRSDLYARVATLMGTMVLFISQPWINRTLLDQPSLSEDASSILVLHFWLVSVLGMALTTFVALRRIEVSVKDTSPQEEVARFKERVSEYITVIHGARARVEDTERTP